MDYIILSSKKRATGYTPTKFRIQLKDPIVGKYWLSHAIIPNTSPALRSTGLVIKIASTESTVFVNPAGVYTAAQAVTALQTALNVVSSIFTVTQDASTHRLNVARTGTATVDFYPRWFKAASTLSSQLGLFSNLQISGSSGSSVSFDGPLQLAAPLAYRIRLNNHSSFEDTNGTRLTSSTSHAQRIRLTSLHIVRTAMTNNSLLSRSIQRQWIWNYSELMRN